MTEALWGVVIGGLIASVTPVFTVLVELRKWQLTQRLSYLRARKEQLEKMCDEIYAAILAGEGANSMPIEIWAKLDLHLPKSVRDEMEQLFQEKERTADNIRGHLFSIQLAMKAVSAKYDREIARLTRVNILSVSLDAEVAQPFDDDQPRGWWEILTGGKVKKS